MAFFAGSIFSNQLKMYTSLHVIIPQTGKTDKKVLYLLHGLSDDSSMWTRRTRVETYAIEHDCIVIMPEVQRSFYTDIVHGANFFSYVSEELPQICEQLFSIRHKRKKTFVAGASMGGYGALKCALRKPEQYIACAAFSGVLDMKTRAADPQAEKIYPEAPVVFGPSGAIREHDDVYALSAQAAYLAAWDKPNILLTCGTSDIFLGESRDFNLHLEQNSYGTHSYLEWEGGHDWSFWDASVKKALEFFDTH